MSDAPELPKVGDKVLIEFEVDRVIPAHAGFDGKPMIRVCRGLVEFYMPLDWITLTRRIET